MATTVPNRDDWFEDDYGFPRPNWNAIDGWMRVYVADAQMEGAWQQVVRHWVSRLRDRLGGDYAVVESENFVLLAEADAKWRANLLSFLERARAQVHRVLGELRAPKSYGKHVILRFTSDRDFYHYLSHFHRDGEYAGVGGVFLSGGYHHIAYPRCWTEVEEGKTLVHELTHDLLAHLPLPPWLNEALAMAFEKDLAGPPEPLTRELARRHREYWNEKTIQEFWFGRSYSDPEGQELAYSLSRVLLDLIHTELRPSPDEFRSFVLRADWSDAGAVAVREHLHEELENLVATFLGPGDWTPKPKEWKPSAATSADELLEAGEEP
jgi:hypothetical protein